MHTKAKVDGSWTVNDAIREYPATVAVFDRFGIDSCCGGAKRLDDVASRHAIDLEALLQAIRDVTGDA